VGRQQLRDREEQLTLAAITQTEVIAWTAFGFLYLVALLVFVRTLMRGPRPLHWLRLRAGFFVEREPHRKDEEDD
jgi:hypothetical protein